MRKVWYSIWDGETSTTGKWIIREGWFITVSNQGNSIEWFIEDEKGRIWMLTDTMNTPRFQDKISKEDYEKLINP